MQVCYQKTIDRCSNLSGVSHIMFEYLTLSTNLQYLKKKTRIGEEFDDVSMDQVTFFQLFFISLHLNFV